MTEDELGSIGVEKVSKMEWDFIKGTGSSAIHWQRLGRCHEVAG